MEYETVTHALGDATIAITVAGPATGHMGMKRALTQAREMERIRTQAAKEPDRIVTLDDEADWILATDTFPALIAATTEIHGMPLPRTSAEFGALDEMLIAKWSDAVYRLNPLWRPGATAQPEQDEKNLSNSGSELQASSAPEKMVTKKATHRRRTS